MKIELKMQADVINDEIVVFHHAEDNLTIEIEQEEHKFETGKEYNITIEEVS